MNTIVKQQADRIEFTKMKNLRDVSIDLAPADSMMTGIFGPNGCGKSTILHVLACCYNALSDQARTYRFAEFFLPTSADIWSGSSFTFHCRQDVSAPKSPPCTNQISLLFEKKKDRWSPRYQKRPSRDCYYIGISTCVPRIETETQTTRVKFSATTAIKERAKILNAASYILGREYTDYELHSSSRGDTYIGVRGEQGAYTELSMGAGEQRVFKILEQFHRAAKNAFFLIDELDLLLHDLSLSRLVEYLKKFCTSNHIQVVFTAHRHSLLGLDGVNFRHIIQTPKKTYCLSRTTPEAIVQLVGQSERPLRVGVEDDVAAAVVSKILEQQGVLPYTSVARFGAVANAITLAGAAAMNETLSGDQVYILDGDVLREKSERENLVRKVITGDDPRVAGMRSAALGAIRQFRIPQGMPPETFIIGCIRRTDSEDSLLSQRDRGIVEAAHQVGTVQNSHDYINTLIDRLGYPREVGLRYIVDMLALVPEWDDYVREMNDWIEERKFAHDGALSGLPKPQKSAPRVDFDVVIIVREDARVECLRYADVLEKQTLGEGVLSVAAGRTDETVMLFTDRGLVLTVNFGNLLEQDGSGTSLRLAVAQERVVAAISNDPRVMPEYWYERPELGDEYEDPYPHFVAITRNGRVVRFSGWRFREPKPRPRRFMNVEGGDNVVTVLKTYTEDVVHVVLGQNPPAQFTAWDVPCSSSLAKGRRPIKPRAKGEVVAAWIDGEDGVEIALVLTDGQAISLTSELTEFERLLLSSVGVESVTRHFEIPVFSEGPPG